MAAIYPQGTESGVETNILTDLSFFEEGKLYFEECTVLVNPHNFHKS